MTTSATNICNMALARIGAKRINDLDAGMTNEAIQCREFYDAQRDALLRGHDWAFAKAQASLARDTAIPLAGYDASYILPADFLRLVEVHDPYTPYEMQGQRILSDDDSLTITYIRRVTDPSKFDVLFVTCLSLAMSAALAMPLANSQSLRDTVLQELERALPKARVVNQQTSQGGPQGTTWREARRSTGAALYG